MVSLVCPSLRVWKFMFGLVYSIDWVRQPAFGYFLVRPRRSRDCTNSVPILAF